MNLELCLIPWKISQRVHCQTISTKQIMFQRDTLSKDTLMYEYRVQFKGYYSEDDMWLPTSQFSRAVNYESVSTFGQKRKHNIDPGAPRKKQEKKRRVAPLQEKEMKNENTESRKSSSQKCRTKAQVKKQVANRTSKYWRKQRKNSQHPSVQNLSELLNKLHGMAILTH